MYINDVTLKSARVAPFPFSINLESLLWQALTLVIK